MTFHFLIFFAALWTSLLTNLLSFLKSQNNLFFASISLPCKNCNSGGVAEWLKAADCKSARVAYVGSNPTPTTILTTHLL